MHALELGQLGVQRNHPGVTDVCPTLLGAQLRADIGVPVNTLATFAALVVLASLASLSCTAGHREKNRIAAHAAATMLR